VEDFKGDGKSDLAVANATDNNVSVLLGNGDGTFQPAMNYSAGTTPYFVAVGDFNGDGGTDLAIANANGNNVSVLLGNGDGTFQAAVNYGTDSTPHSVAVGDFNGDGRADLILADNGDSDVSVLLGLAPAPDLSIVLTHAGNFAQGQSGATYTIPVSNVGYLPTSGTVTVTDQLPPGLAATIIGGTGWTCVLGSDVHAQ
jgi:uncharacterized repeat protein (TIGR01451 family)